MKNLLLCLMSSTTLTRSMLALLLIFTYGCKTTYNLATQQEEFIFISSEREVRMGKSIAEAVEKKFKLLKDGEMKMRVERIGERLQRVGDRKEIDYYFKVIDEDEVNAVALPGGYIYINRGLIEKVESDDELASVIAHELGHITSRHAVKRLQGSLGYFALKVLIAGKKGSGELNRGADVAFGELLLSYSREDELFSDRLAVKYMRRAGFDPRAMISFLEKLRDIERERPLRPKRRGRTHPYLPDRLRVVREEIFGKIKFEDYINIDQNLP